jgi:hypothetical protein
VGLFLVHRPGSRRDIPYRVHLGVSSIFSKNGTILISRRSEAVMEERGMTPSARTIGGLWVFSW